MLAARGVMSTPAGKSAMDEEGLRRIYLLDVFTIHPLSQNPLLVSPSHRQHEAAAQKLYSILQDQGQLKPPLIPYISMARICANNICFARYPKKLADRPHRPFP